MSMIFLIAFAILSGANWIAAAVGETEKELVLKPAALAALLLFGLNGGAPTMVLTGLLFSLLGDVYLMLPGKALFVAGLVSFLTAHILYIAALPASLVASLPVWAALLGLTVPLTCSIVGAVKGCLMRIAVVAYMLAILFMAAAAIASGSWLGVAGALLFVVSDSMLAWDMFVKKFQRAHLYVMVTYHLGQVGIVLSLLP